MSPRRRALTKAQLAQSRRRPGLRATILGLSGAVFLVLISGPLPAQAHAGLVRVQPANGSTVTTAPTRVRLVFDENIRSPSAIIVTDPSGHHVQTGQVRLLNNTASIAVHIVSPGAYTVAYRVVSADGHPVAAQTSFTVGGTQEAGGSTTKPDTGAAGGGGVSTGWVVGGIAVLALLGGVALLTLRRAPRRPRP
jgi:methionine-rich copper-binding protein CopC